MNDGAPTAGCVTAAYFNSGLGIEYDVGVRRWADSSVQADEITYQNATYRAPQFATGCYDGCCTQAVNRMYAGASIQDLTSSIVAIESKLETQWVRLCADSANQMGCASRAWGGITSGELSGTQWIQAGYENNSYRDSVGIQRFSKVAYVELSPNLEGDATPLKRTVVGFGDDSLDVFPLGQSVLHYMVVVNDSLDVWGVQITSTQEPPDTVLLGGTLGQFSIGNLNYASWLGELTHWENDMVGTVSDSCTFSDCRYANKGDDYFINASFNSSDVVSSDSDQWGSAVHDDWYLRNNVDIWDKNPQQ